MVAARVMVLRSAVLEMIVAIVADVRRVSRVLTATRV